MFWGAISGNGPVSLIPINGTMTAEKYVTTLREHLFPFLENQPLAVRYVFQQVNAPSHKAQQTIAFFQDNAIEVLDKWPPYSTDLNVIENLWSYIKTKVRRENIILKEHLCTHVLDIWARQDTRELCGRLAASMVKRIAKCIKNISLLVALFFTFFG
jgi:transposase